MHSNSESQIKINKSTARLVVNALKWDDKEKNMLSISENSKLMNKKKQHYRPFLIHYEGELY